jgi:hypothetical protein
LGLFDSSLNSTHIALIPKSSPTVDVSNFRPMSQCNVLYKIIAKVLANINAHKDEGEEGLYNNQIGYEQGLRQSGVEIPRRNDAKNGFADLWIALIMKCVTTVSYSVLVNGIPHGKIHPTRGIRQGDPLSPYLFLICVEGLSSLLQ